MSEVFLEIVLNASELAENGYDSRDEIEDPLDETLCESGLGEVTGGGGGMERYVIDVEVDETRFDEALEQIKQVLRALRVPRSTLIKRNQPNRLEFAVYD